MNVINDDYDDWTNVELDSMSGEYSVQQADSKVRLFNPQSTVHKQKYPDHCPNCDVRDNINKDNQLTSISKHGTGVQKVNQVIADALLRTLKADDGKKCKGCCLFR